MITKFRRTSDDKVFSISTLDLVHWSEVTAEDGETDTIKWIGDNMYVSNWGKGTYIRFPTSLEKLVNKG